MLASHSVTLREHRSHYSNGLNQNAANRETRTTQGTWRPGNRNRQSQQQQHQQRDRSPPSLFGNLDSRAPSPGPHIRDPPRPRSRYDSPPSHRRRTGLSHGSEITYHRTETSDGFTTTVETIEINRHWYPTPPSPPLQLISTNMAQNCDRRSAPQQNHNSHYSEETRNPHSTSRNDVPYQGQFSNRPPRRQWIPLRPQQATEPTRQDHPPSLATNESGDFEYGQETIHQSDDRGINYHAPPFF